MLGQIITIGRVKYTAMCWNYAYIFIRKLLRCGSHRKWNKWLMSAGGHHTFLLTPNNNRHQRRNRFAVGQFSSQHSWSAAKQSALRRLRLIPCPCVKHGSHCQGEPDQSVLIRVFFSLLLCLLKMSLGLFVFCNHCFCSNTVNMLSS